LTRYRPEPETQARLTDGAAVTLRAIRPEDSDLEKEFIRKLSPETMRLRFQGSLRELTPEMLASFTRLDFDRDMAFVALTGHPPEQREIGVCRYCALSDLKSCEFAIVVADEWCGRGLGKIMMIRLIAVARARGLKSMLGMVLAYNEPMLHLGSGLGFVVRHDPGDPTVVQIVLTLA
jgi:acetyltransferase